MKLLKRILPEDEVLDGSWQRWSVAFVYGWFLINIAMMWSVRDYLWGTDTVLVRFGAGPRMIDNFVYMLVYDLDKFPFVFYPHIIAAALSMFDRWWSFIPRIIAWITGILLYYAATPVFNSGMLLMLLLAFYCIPFYSRSAHPIRIMLTNAAVWAAKIQVVLVYAFSLFFKLSGTQWLAGDAVYYTLQIDRFSNDFFRASSTLKDKLLMMSMDYAALLYHAIFPAVVWLKKGRKALLIVGICFHLFIGIVMHLWDFALAMIFAYAFFFPSNSKKIV
jgi:hypothetical protein